MVEAGGSYLDKGQLALNIPYNQHRMVLTEVLTLL